MPESLVWTEDWDNPGDWLLEPKGTGLAATLHAHGNGYIWMIRKPGPGAKGETATRLEAQMQVTRRILTDLSICTRTGDSNTWSELSTANPDHTFHRISFAAVAGEVRAEIDFQSTTDGGPPRPGSVVVVRGTSKYGQRHANFLSEKPMAELRAEAVKLAEAEVARLKELKAKLVATISDPPQNIAYEDMIARSVRSRIRPRAPRAT